MKKTFQLAVEGKNPDRLLDSIKNEIRKYIKRESGRPVPAGVDFWDFDCKFGATLDAAIPAHHATLTKLVDALVAQGGKQFYIEILAKHGRRMGRPAP